MNVKQEQPPLCKIGLYLSNIWICTYNAYIILYYYTTTTTTINNNNNYLYPEGSITSIIWTKVAMAWETLKILCADQSDIFHFSRNTLSCLLECKIYSVQNKNFEQNVLFKQREGSLWSQVLCKYMVPCNIIASYFVINFLVSVYSVHLFSNYFYVSECDAV